MLIDRNAFSCLNLPANFTLPQTLDYFTLTARHDTQIWRKPLSRDLTTAPIIHTCLRHPFILAEVTVTAEWECEWDQAGLVIFAGAPPGDEDNSFPSPASLRNQRRSRSSPRGGEPPVLGKWVKAGLEFTGGVLNASSVVAASSDGCDWSLSPISILSLPHEAFPASMSSLRIKFERIGNSLWIWYRLPGLASSSETPSPAGVSAEWRKLREVMGFFAGVEDKGGVWVGCYASRPMQWMPTHSWEGSGGVGAEDSMGRCLVVDFEDLEIL